MTTPLIAYDPSVELLPAGLHDVENLDTLRVAVLVSLFSDATAPAEDAEKDDRRGWWADAYDADRIGSLIWTVIDRGKTTNAAAAAIEQYASDALAWLIEDGIATAVEVSAERISRERIDLVVTIRRDESADVEYRFADLWGRT